MGLLQISKGDALYPGKLDKLLGSDAPEILVAQGNYYLLEGKKLAFFCPSPCPTEIALDSYVFAQQMRNSPMMVIGGFDSEVERECLNIIMESPAPVVVCPARDIESMRISQEQREVMETGRLLFLSQCTEKGRQLTEASNLRNNMVVALSDGVLMAHSGSGVRMEKMCCQIMDWGIPLYTFPNKANKKLVDLGAQTVFADHAFGTPRRRR